MRTAINILRNSNAQYPMMSEDGIVKAIKEAMVETIKECIEIVHENSILSANNFIEPNLKKLIEQVK